jgi:prevent-host-death family protein
MKIVNILEAKSTLSKLIDAVETGREKEIVIVRHGRRVAP